MPVYVDESTPADQLCRCGRLAKKIHCPGCGGYSVLGYGPKKDIERVLPDGTRKTFPTFRCRRCSLTFDDLEWRVTCEAPRFETRSMRQRRTDQEVQLAFQSIVASKGGDRKEALRELFAKQGLVKSTVPTVESKKGE